MEKLYRNKKDCTGCTACLNVCPKKAIQMCEDKEGFLYPKIKEELCVECGLCQKVCHLKNNKYQELKNKNNKFYLVKHKDKDVLCNSSSGGAFTAISDCILEDKGQVYGVTLDKDMKVVHTMADNISGRDNMRGSKYVQSDMGSIYQKIKKELKNSNTKILFTGTPCQIAGLKAYIGEKKEIEKLILCDIICHGVTSPKVWKNHIEYIQSKYKRKVLNYRFRLKTNGWKVHTEGISFDGNKFDYKSSISQAYKYIFHSEKCLRPSCYNCKYTSVNRVSDITIADFWGVEKSIPELYDEKGVSLVIVNTKKGQEIFERMKENIIYRECKLEDCLQPQLRHPTKMPEERNVFWKEYFDNGHEYILKKYTCYGGKRRLRFEIKKYLPKSFKLIIRKIIK